MNKSIYIASSWKNAHAVEMLTDIFESKGYEVKSFILNANEEDLNCAAVDFDKFVWSEGGKFSFDYDTTWAATADIVVYVGPSGCDAWAEIGIAYSNKRPIYALQAKGEPIGLMRRLVTKWFDAYQDLVEHIANENPTVMIRELEELLQYGFKRISTEGEADIAQQPEYVKNVEGVRWGVHVEGVRADEKKVVITNDKRAVRYCDSMEALTEKLIEYNLLI